MVVVVVVVVVFHWGEVTKITNHTVDYRRNSEKTEGDSWKASQYCVAIWSCYGNDLTIRANEISHIIWHNTKSIRSCLGWSREYKQKTKQRSKAKR